MAYMGAIDYLALKFGSIDWEVVRSPWSGLGSTGGGGREIGAQVRRVKALPEGDRGGKLFFDVIGAALGSEAEKESRLECVVLGVEQQTTSTWWPVTERLHYLLLVKPVGELRGSGGERVYERIGAGYLPGWTLEEKGEWIVIR